MIATRLLAALAAAGLALAATPAAADTAATDDGSGAGGPAAGTEVGAARLTAPARRLVVHALLEVGLSKDSGGAPVSIAPDLWYGLTRGLTVGVVHSSRATTGMLGGAGDGLCVSGDGDGLCERFYDGGGLLARVHLASGALSVALDGGVIARGTDPLALSAKAGFVARLQAGPIALELTPNVWLGLTERDGEGVDVMHVPVALSLALGRRLALLGQVGMIAPFEDFRDEVVIATSAGAQVRLGAQTFVDVVFSLPHWLDTDRTTYGLDARTFSLGVGHAF